MAEADSLDNFTFNLAQIADAQNALAEQGRRFRRDQNETCIKAIEALSKGHILHAKEILDSFLTQEAE